MPGDTHSCKVCANPYLAEIPEFRSLPRVTSDCMPFRPGGRLLVCGACGAAQSPSDEQWLSEIREIYNNYRPYHQAGGVEQHVADPTTGQLRRRSQILVERYLALPDVPRSGKVIDIGCGTGATLRALSERGGWRLYGSEIDTKNIHSLASLDGFEALYTGAPSELPGRFDLITMVHALEHFPDPVEVLRDVRNKIAPGGRLFVEVPNSDSNPFDLVIADHMMHFTPDTLCALAVRAGFKADCLATTWVAKELSLTARCSEPQADDDLRSNASFTALHRVRGQVNWLGRFVDTSREASAAARSFGLFGTSIVATWLSSFLGDSVSFFVDEDPNRAGGTYLGRPVIHPSQVQQGSVVYLALIPEIAAKVELRLRSTIPELRLPPANLSGPGGGGGS
ncbi:MAG TPA: class I SAM-dependent methyltransferase [Bryobacteraceae bacterium]